MYNKKWISNFKKKQTEILLNQGHLLCCYYEINLDKKSRDNDNDLSNYHIQSNLILIWKYSW